MKGSTMTHPNRGRLAAVVVGTLTMVTLAGAGGAVAAGKITSADIANRTIRGVDLADNSVTSRHVRNGGILSVDIRDGRVRFVDLNDYTRKLIREPGPKGDPGEPGPKGDPGEPGVSGLVYEGPEVRWSDGPGQVVASCEEGKTALGGGFTVQGIRGGDAVVKTSQPVYVDPSTASGWLVEGVATGEANVKAWVVCAAVAD